MTGRPESSPAPSPAGGRPARPSGRPSAGPAAPYGWWPLVVLSSVVLLSGINSNLTAGALPLIIAEFDVSDSAAGTLETGTAVASVALALPAGYLADRYPRARIMAVVLAGAAVVTLGSVLAVSFGMLFLARTVLAGETSADDPPAASLLADYYPLRVRARAYGLHRMCYFAGVSVGSVIGGVVGEALGWRGAYAVALLPAAVLAVLCWRLREPARGALDPPDSPGPDSRAVDDGSARGPAPSSPAPRAGPRPFLAQLTEILRNGPLLRTAVAVCGLFLGAAAFGFWTPSYYVREYGLTPGEAASLGALIDLTGMVAGAVVGSWLGDRWSARRATATTAGAATHVRVGGVAALAGSAVLLAALTVPVLPAQAAVFGIAVFLLGVAIPNLTAGIADLQSGANRGTGFAVVQLLTAAGGALGPLAAGTVSDTTGSLGLGLAATAAVMLAASLLPIPGGRTAR